IGLVAKCVGLGYFPITSLRKVPGFEHAQIEHPMSGGGYGFVLHLSITPRENSLRASGFANLFVAGEKCGLGGIAEVIATGVLAGNNAARVAFGQQPMELPRDTAIGDIIAFRGERMSKSEGLRVACGMAHGVYFERMKELGFYSLDPAVSRKRIAGLGLTNVFGRRLV
ncbi:MAG: FAD-dependent oxidoreductase, partial [Dehalococcoidia bacterium]|nr:FAD-dependent oxidoreductase [Dehalococcoidia bacterium]